MDTQGIIASESKSGFEQRVVSRFPWRTQLFDVVGEENPVLRNERQQDDSDHRIDVDELAGNEQCENRPDDCEWTPSRSRAA
jgi:hypothetical protein